MLSENPTTIADPVGTPRSKELGDCEPGSSRGDQSYAAGRYTQATPPLRRGGDGESATRVGISYTVAWLATIGSNPAMQQAYPQGDGQTAQVNLVGFPALLNGWMGQYTCLDVAANRATDKQVTKSASSWCTDPSSVVIKSSR